MHTVHPREASNQARKSFTLRYAEGIFGIKKEKTVRNQYGSIQSATQKQDRVISGTLISNTEKCYHQGWPDRSSSQGRRKHKCLPRQR